MKKRILSIVMAMVLLAGLPAGSQAATVKLSTKKLTVTVKKSATLTKLDLTNCLSLTTLSCDSTVTVIGYQKPQNNYKKEEVLK